MAPLIIDVSSFNKQETRFFMCVILNEAFLRSRMKQVLKMSDIDRFFLQVFAYNKIVSLVNFWISAISSKPSTMKLATLRVAPIENRTVAASCAAVHWPTNPLPDQ